MGLSIARVTALVLFCGWITRLLVNYFAPGLSGIPGPFLAKFSDFWRFVDACSGQHHHTIVRLHQQYGPVVRIGPYAVSVSDPAAIEAVLSLKANLDKTDAVNPMINTYDGEPMPMLISAKGSDIHARIKRPIAGSYSMSSALAMEPVLDHNINKVLSQLRKFGHDKPCPIGNWMEYFAFDLILQVTFSQNWGFLDAGKDVDGMLKLLDLQFTYIGTLGAMPWLDNLLLKNPLLLMVVKTPNTLVDFASAQVKARLQNSSKTSASGGDFLEQFIQAQKANPASFSNLQLTTYAATNILAASDTTSATLTTVLYHILKHPDVHAKVKTEIDNADLSIPATYAESSTLRYLDATIKEATRVFPTTGIELERKVGPNGLILPSGHRLPAGASVGLNAWAVHRDTTIFGDDAERFRPERWLKHNRETEVAFEERLQRMRRASLSFGAGPRGCLGKHLAMLQLYKVIASLFRTFEISLCDPHKMMKTRSTITVKILDVEVLLEPR